MKVCIMPCRPSSTPPTEADLEARRQAAAAVRFLLYCTHHTLLCGELSLAYAFLAGGAENDPMQSCASNTLLGPSAV